MRPDDQFPGVRIEGLGQGHALDARVVDEDVESAFGRPDRSEQGLDRSAIGNIAANVADVLLGRFRFE